MPDAASAGSLEPTLSAAPCLDPSHPMIRSLYYRAMDAVEKESIFRDQTAQQIVEKFYDQLHVLECVPAGLRHLLTTRCMLMDLYCCRFIETYAKQNRSCTVLNLSGGIDTRVYRIQPKGHVQWFEVDRPAWLDLRAQSVTTPIADNVHWIPFDLQDPSWLEGDESWLHQIPQDNPTVIILEGSAATLRKAQFEKIIKRLLDHLQTGELIVDVYGRAAQIFVSTKWLSWSRKVGISIEWSCENPTSLESIHPKLKLRDQKSAVTMAEEDFNDWASVIGKVKFSMLKGGIFGSTVRTQSRVLQFTF